MGLILFAMGIGIFTSRKYYIKIYRDIEKETLAMLAMSIGMIAVGVVWVTQHNLWDSTPAVIISLLGWGSLIKGFVFAIFPEWIDKMGNRFAKSSGLFNFAGFVLLLLGAYLSWIGFYA